MTEWLNENARRAYPLDREWPDGLAELWTPVLLDACVGVSRILNLDEGPHPYKAVIESVYNDGTAELRLPDYEYPDSVVSIDWMQDASMYANYKIVAGPSVTFSAGHVGAMSYSSTDGRFQFVTATPNKTSTYPVDTQRHTLAIDVRRGTFSVDGHVVLTHQIDQMERSTNLIWLPGRAAGWTYGARLWRGDALVRDLVPVRISDVDDATAAGGFYDKVSGTVFQSTAAKSFLCGPDVLGFDTRTMLKSVRRESDGSAVTLRLAWCTSTRGFVDVRIPAGLGRTATVALGGGGSEATGFLTVSGTAVDRICASNMPAGWHAVNIPFAVRCCSYANACVTAVEAYTPDADEQCSHPVFDARPRTPVAVLTGDVVLKASDGVDLETVDSPDGSGTVLRVSAIPGEIDESVAEKATDMVIRGDACIAVEARPGVRMEGGEEVADPDYGLILIGSKCKPCCQCDDYVDAVKTLRPYETAAEDIHKTLKDAKKAYDLAADAFDRYKRQSLVYVNSYANLNASAVAVCSCSELYKGATTASGTRSRIAITLTVENMTQDTATLSELSAQCPGYTSFDSVTWATAGSKTLAGSSVTGLSWFLKPGDTLTASWTFIRTSTTNHATKPTGMSVTARARLTSQPTDFTLSPEVK